MELLKLARPWKVNLPSLPDLHPMSSSTLYLEVIPLRTAEEVGGFSRAAVRRMGVAAAATMNGSGELTVFLQKDWRKLVQDLKSAKRVVGYNCIEFDYELIRGEEPFRRPKTTDLMLVIGEAVGKRISMEKAVQGTLGEGVVPDAWIMMADAKAGHWDKVEEAIRQKLGLMRQMHEHLLTKGTVEVLKGSKWCSFAIPPLDV
jgi:hypothetical protein